MPPFSSPLELGSESLQPGTALPPPPSSKALLTPRLAYLPWQCTHRTTKLKSHPSASLRRLPAKQGTPTPARNQCFWKPRRSGLGAAKLAGGRQGRWLVSAGCRARGSRPGKQPRPPRPQPTPHRGRRRRGARALNPAAAELPLSYGGSAGFRHSRRLPWAPVRIPLSSRAPEPRRSRLPAPRCFTPPPLPLRRVAGCPSCHSSSPPGPKPPSRRAWVSFPGGIRPMRCHRVLPAPLWKTTTRDSLQQVGGDQVVGWREVMAESLMTTCTFCLSLARGPCHWMLAFRGAGARC